jgi:hypothetical protein
MPTASSFDHLFGLDAPIGYAVWLDVSGPTLSPRPLHSLVVLSGLIEVSQQSPPMATGGQRCSVDLIQHSTTGNPLPNSLTLNLTTPMTTVDVHLHQLHTVSICCILLAMKAVSLGRFPFIILVAALSMATLGIHTPGNPPGILLADI